jgi:hypothetical protein
MEAIINGQEASPREGNQNGPRFWGQHCACDTIHARTHTAQPAPDCRFLGWLVRLDAGRHGFYHLCARPWAGIDGAAAAFGHRGNPGKRWIRRLPHVRLVPGGLGSLVHLGADLRQVRPHQVARGHDTVYAVFTGSKSVRLAVGAFDGLAGVASLGRDMILGLEAVDICAHLVGG